MPTEAAFALWISQPPIVLSVQLAVCTLGIFVVPIVGINAPTPVPYGAIVHQFPILGIAKRNPFWGFIVPVPLPGPVRVYPCIPPLCHIPLRNKCIQVCRTLPSLGACCHCAMYPSPPACALRAQKSAPAVSAEAFCGLCSLPHPERAPQLHGSCVPSRTAVFQGTGAPAWTPAHRADCACQEGVRVRRRGIAPCGVSPQGGCQGLIRSRSRRR